MNEDVIISVAIDVMNDVIISQSVFQPSPSSRFFVQPADQVPVRVLQLDKLILDGADHLYETPETRRLRFVKNKIGVGATFFIANEYALCMAHKKCQPLISQREICNFEKARLFVSKKIVCCWRAPISNNRKNVPLCI